METRRFTKNDSGFICAHCGKEVQPLGYTSRNHCPFCLWSLHLDENPGDRASDCGGQMGIFLAFFARVFFSGKMFAVFSKNS